MNCPEPATQWAYDHDDPNELIEQVKLMSGNIGVVAYSLDLSHYRPLCRPCHYAADTLVAESG